MFFAVSTCSVLYGALLLLIPSLYGGIFLCPQCGYGGCCFLLHSLKEEYLIAHSVDMKSAASYCILYWRMFHLSTVWIWRVLLLTPSFYGGIFLCPQFGYGGSCSLSHHLLANVKCFLCPQCGYGCFLSHPLIGEISLCLYAMQGGQC